MQKLSQARINTLKSIVMHMSQYELKTALLMILDGIELDYAIEIALNPRPTTQ